MEEADRDRLEAVTLVANADAVNEEIAELRQLAGQARERAKVLKGP